MMNKYHARKYTVNGKVFDSKKEARRYAELCLLQEAGKICQLETQKKYVLIPTQREPDTRGKRGGIKAGKLLEREVAYYADFAYIDNETYKQVCEDVKGYKGGGAYTVFTIKRKLMLWRYGIKVREI